MVLLNIITIGSDTNYNNLQGSSPHNRAKNEKAETQKIQNNKHEII